MGGASQPKPGVGDVISLGVGAIASFIAPVVGEAMSIILAPIIAGLVDIGVAEYCATDPPADPGLTQADVLQAVAMPPDAASFAAQRKVVQWFEYQFWPSICECTSIPTPSLPGPSNPGGATTNPGLPQQSTHCWTQSLTWTCAARVSTVVATLIDFGNKLLPPGVPTVSPVDTATSPTTWNLYPVTPGATTLDISGTLNEATVVADGVELIWQAFDSSFHNVATGTTQLIFTGTTPISTSTPHRDTLPSTAAWWSAVVVNGDSIGHSGTFGVSFWCPPGTTVGQACCPPDPLLEGLLQQALQLLNAIYQSLPVPLTSYASGTAHGGLSGSGTVVLGAGAIAFRVNLTTVPAGYGATTASPNYFFDLGWVTPGALSEPFQQQRVAIDGQVFVLPAASTEIFYTLNAGVVIAITELTRGP